MIQNYTNLKHQVDNFQTILGSSDRGATIQKIYSTPHFLILSLRLPGETKYMYLGRGSGHEGVWIHGELAPSNLRIKDKFLDFIRSTIRNGQLFEIRVEEKNRAIYLNIRFKNDSKKLAFFWCGRKLYFSLAEHGTKNRKLNSWTGRFEGEENFDFQVNEFTDVDSEKQSSSVGSNTGIEEYLQFYSGKTISAERGTKKRKALQRKKRNIERDLDRCKSVIDIKRMLIEDKLNLEGETFEVEGFRIKLNQADNYFLKKDKIFKKIKRILTGEKILSKRLHDVEKEIENFEKAKNFVKAKILNPVWEDSKKPITKNEVEGDYLTLLYGPDVKILIGKSASGNDFIRSKKSNKEDFWFHLDGRESPHAICNIRNRSELSGELLEVIASILRDRSNLSILEIPVLYTQVKNLKGVKGQKGAVTFKKEKRISVRYNPEWKEIISIC